MTEVIKLEAQTREKGEDVKALIKNGLIPAVIYGPHLKENKLVKINTNEVKKVLTSAGESTLIDLILNGKAEGKVLIKEDQRDPVKDNLIHIDLYEVDMSKEITAEITLHFIGESTAIKNFGGSLIRSINEVEVKCLPTALISHLDVDISVLNTFEDVIKISDLKLPEGIKLVHETNDVVATIAKPKEEEIFAVAPSEQEASAISAANAEAEKKIAEKTEAKDEKK